jgi:DNA primase
MLVQQNSLTILINKVLGQSAKCRMGGTQLLYHCPFCRESKRIPKLEVCLDQQNFGIWHCWICNAKGGSISNLFKKVKTKKSYLTELYSITKDQKEFKRRKHKEKTKEENLVLPDDFKPMAIPSTDPDYKHILRYLRKRGITRDDILRYNIGYCSSGEYRNRIVIPSYDANGDLNFFVTRTYYDTNDIAYKNCPFSKDIVGFELFVNWDEPITLVEGVFDAMSVRRNAIPLFGKVMSNSLKEALIDNGVTHVNVCLDNDALKDSYNISKFLMDQGIEVNLIKLEDKDPSVIGFDNVFNIINVSRTLEFADILSLKMCT